MSFHSMWFFCWNEGIMKWQNDEHCLSSKSWWAVFTWQCLPPLSGQGSHQWPACCGPQTHWHWPTITLVLESISECAHKRARRSISRRNCTKHYPASFYPHLLLTSNEVLRPTFPLTIASEKRNVKTFPVFGYMTNERLWDEIMWCINQSVIRI